MSAEVLQTERGRPSPTTRTELGPCSHVVKKSGLVHVGAKTFRDMPSLVAMGIGRVDVFGQVFRFLSSSANMQREETAEERKVRLRKLAMWNAAQKKGMTDVVGRAETTVDIKVGLMKPLGTFNFTQRKFCDMFLRFFKCT